MLPVLIWQVTRLYLCVYYWERVSRILNNLSSNFENLTWNKTQEKNIFFIV